jgi:hypothetical protein
MKSPEIPRFSPAFLDLAGKATYRRLEREPDACRDKNEDTAV